MRDERWPTDSSHKISNVNHPNPVVRSREENVIFTSSGEKVTWASSASWNGMRFMNRQRCVTSKIASLKKVTCKLPSRGVSIRIRRSSAYSLTPLNANLVRVGRRVRDGGGDCRLSTSGRD